MGGATGTEWVETRDAARHPTCTGQVPTMKNDPTLDVNSVEVEKPSYVPRHQVLQVCSHLIS